MRRRVYSGEARGRGGRGLSAVRFRVGGDGPLGPREQGQFLDKRGKHKVVAKEKILCSIRNCPSNFACPSNYTHKDTSS